MTRLGLSRCGFTTRRTVCFSPARSRVTPLRPLTKWNAFARFRRMIGLFAFFYGTLHFLTYVIAD